MTRRYDVRTGMIGEDPDAARPREELVPGWHVPGPTRYDYDLRIGDAERDTAMTQLREHFVAGRLTFDELTERIDAALVAKTQRQVDRLLADLPRPPRARPRRARAARPGTGRGPVPGLRDAALRAGHLDTDHGLDGQALRLERAVPAVPPPAGRRLERVLIAHLGRIAPGRAGPGGQCPVRAPCLLTSGGDPARLYPGRPRASSVTGDPGVPAVTRSRAGPGPGRPGQTRPGAM